MTKLFANDVSLTPLKQIKNPKGDVYHALKSSEESFSEFGEAYFSTVLQNEIKGWKKHKKMLMNLVVPVGSVRFVLFDERPDSSSCGVFSEVTLSQDNYCRLTVPPGIWMAFEGKDKGLNLVLNIASIEHEPTEAENVDIEQFYYDWSCEK